MNPTFALTQRLKRSIWILLLSLGQGVSVVLLTAPVILLQPTDNLPAEAWLRGTAAVVGPVIFAMWTYASLLPMGRSRSSAFTRWPSLLGLRSLCAAYSLWWIALIAYGVLLGRYESFSALLWIVPLCGLIASHVHAPQQQIKLLWTVLLAQAMGLIGVGVVGWGLTSANVVETTASFLLTCFAYQLSQMRIKDFTAARTTAKEREEERSYLVQQVSHLQEANSAKSRLLAMVSHDLRQPVHALGLMLGRLRREASVTSLRVEVDEVNEVVGSLSNSLNMLMAVTRLNSGRMTAQAEPVSLGKLFESLAYEFQHVAAVKGLSLQFESHQLGVYTDPAHLRTILNNLVGNAVKYSLRGTVRLTAASISEDQAVICVQDEGVGIPEPDLERIFEPFVRLRYNKTSAEGTGLGLAIVKQMADLIKAPIQVQSEVDVGTTFTLTLPRCETSSPEIASAPEVLLRGLRVVVVDNDETVLGSVAMALEEFGCRVIAASGWEVLEAKLEMTVSPIDLILTDYHLDAGTSGYDLIVQLRARYGASIPAILLTGDVEIRHGSDSDSAGIVIAYKPLPYDKLARLIEDAVRKEKNL